MIITFRYPCCVLFYFINNTACVNQRVWSAGGGGILRPFIKPICGGPILHLFSLHDVGVSSVFHKITPRSKLYGQYLQIFIIFYHSNITICNLTQRNQLYKINKLYHVGIKTYFLSNMRSVLKVQSQTKLMLGHLTSMQDPKFGFH